MKPKGFATLTVMAAVLIILAGAVVYVAVNKQSIAWILGSNRQAFQSGTFSVTGTFVPGGIECRRFEADDGKFYSLVFGEAADKPEFKNGDRAVIRGIVPDTSYCMQDTTINVSAVERIGVSITLSQAAYYNDTINPTPVMGKLVNNLSDSIYILTGCSEQVPQIYLRNGDGWQRVAQPQIVCAAEPFVTEITSGESFDLLWDQRDPSSNNFGHIVTPGNVYALGVAYSSIKYDEHRIGDTIMVLSHEFSSSFPNSLLAPPLP